MERHRRFELPPSVWKTDMLPLNTNAAKEASPTSQEAISLRFAGYLKRYAK